MSQMTFQWPARISYAAEDYTLCESNARAVAFLERWPGQGDASAVALLVGAAASGKTHLAHLWAERTGARFIDPALVGTCPSHGLWPRTACAVLEDISLLRDEAAVFHLLRHAETHGLHLLLTSAQPAAMLPFALPDLRSRLLSYPAAAIDPPDTPLLTAFMMKCFSDHQVRISEEAVAFLLQRMERSLHGARILVETLVHLSLETRRDITVPWIKSLPATVLSSHER